MNFNTLLRPRFSALRAAPERPVPRGPSRHGVHEGDARGSSSPEPDEISDVPHPGGGAIISAAGYTFSAFFWIAALSLGALLGYFVTTQYAASPATAVPTIPRAATGEVNSTSTLASVPAAYTSRPLGPRDETVCPAKPLVSNAGQNLPACQTVRRIFDELLEQVLLPFWLGPDGLGVDCESGGFANLGLQPGTIGAGEAWKLRERWLARTPEPRTRLRACIARAATRVPKTPPAASRGARTETETHIRRVFAMARRSPWRRTRWRSSATRCVTTCSAVTSPPSRGRRRGHDVVRAHEVDKHLEGIAAVLMAAAEISMAAEAGGDEAKEAAETADDAFATMQREHGDALPGGGFWPEATERDWSLPDTKHPPRTARRAPRRARGVDDVRRFARRARARGQASWLPSRTRSPMTSKAAKKTLGDDVEVGSTGDEGTTRSPPSGRSSGRSKRSDSGTSRRRTRKRQAFRIVPGGSRVLRSRWNPSPASLHVRGPDDVDPVTGVGAFDVRFGRVLELTWTLLEASRAVERAAFATRGAGGSVADRSSSDALPRPSCARRLAWTFGLHDGGASSPAWAGCGAESETSTEKTWTITRPGHDRERGEWWAELEATTSALHDWELTGSREARNRFVKELGVVWGYFVDWKSEPQAGTLARKFASAGMRASSRTSRGEGGTAGEPRHQEERRKDPFRAVRAVLELQDVLEQGWTARASMDEMRVRRDACVSVSNV